jgi:rubredoxin
MKCKKCGFEYQEHAFDITDSDSDYKCPECGTKYNLVIVVSKEEPISSCGF